MIGELVPRVAAVIEDVCIGLEHAVRQPVVTHEVPDILDGVEFWTFRRQGVLISPVAYVNVARRQLADGAFYRAAPPPKPSVSRRRAGSRSA